MRKRKPEIRIVAGRNFSTASIGDETVAVKWGSSGGWWTAVAGGDPVKHETEALAVKAFFGAAVEMAAKDGA